MCPIPDFDENGLLPEGIYDCDLKVLECRFVDRFPDSPTRSGLFEEFVKWVSKAAKLVPSATEWIDGSYVTAKPAPNDIDVVTFCDAAFLTSLSGDDEDRVELHLNSREKPIHTMLIGVYPETDPQYPLYQAEVRTIGKWGFAKLWIKKEGEVFRTDIPKGFLQMPIGNESIAPNVSINWEFPKQE
jgi:hypothetical protein